MDTHGHEETAETAGIPLLDDAFKPRMGTPRLNAFYLGNWLTDLSQVIDPQVEQLAKSKAHGIVDTALDWLLNNTFFNNGPVFKVVSEFVHLESILAELHDETHTFFDSLIDDVLKQPPQPPDEDQSLEPDEYRFLKSCEDQAVQPDTVKHSLLFQVAQAGILLKAYFKFVHPKKTGEPPRMDLKAFFAVFKTHFTQYYPHEHFDRPAKKIQVEGARTQYEDEGPSTGTVPQQHEHDLYGYLRKDIEVVAGLLTDLDLTWARDYLSRPIGVSTFGDDDIAWNLGLAKLGHAAHGIEDFFAHSNFIEHAALAIGGPEKFVPAVYQLYYSRFYKRLKRYNYLSDPSDWRANVDEEYVVTGYFDFIDTLNSLCHMVMDGLLGILDLESRDVTEDARFFVNLQHEPKDEVEARVREASTYFRDLMELIEVLKEDPNKITEVKNNKVVSAVKEILKDNMFTEDLGKRAAKLVEIFEQPCVDTPTMELIVGQMPLFKEMLDLKKAPINADDEDVAALLRAMFSFIHFLRKSVAYAGYTISLYKFLSELTEFIGAPVVWLTKKLKEKVRESAKDYLVSVGIYFTKELVLYSWGSSRIGCHSLLSKDHKVHEEILYKPMSNCATAVHHVVIETMMRWSDANYNARPENQKWVNWLELLEFFLCHPRFGLTGAIEKEVLTDVIHFPTGAERALGLDKLIDHLVTLYQPLALPPHGERLDRQKILEKNLTVTKIRGKIHKYDLVNLHRTATITSAPPLLILGIVIPYLPHKVKIYDSASVDAKWYTKVMNEDWEEIKTNNPHPLVFHVSQAASEAERIRINNMKVALQNEYNQVRR